MNKKAWFLCGGCLVAGLVIGYFAATVRYGIVVANTLALLQMTHMGESDDRAFQAYRHESAPVVIYALTESLDRLKAVEDLGETPYMSKQMMAFDGILTHARLAKLYLETGQTNLSEQHISVALDCAKEVPTFRGITNRVELLKLVNKADEGAK